MQNTLNRHRFGVGAMVLCLAAISQAPQTASAGSSFDLDYSTLTVLPSATGQGLYYGNSYPFPSEATSFQVDSGALRIWTQPYNIDRSAYYQLDNGYDHLIDAEYLVRARVTDGTSSALSFSFGDSARYGGFGISPTRYTIDGYGNNYDFGFDPKEYHDYHYFAEAATGKFTFSIDGTVVFTGNLSFSPVNTTSYAAFGHFGSSNNSGSVTGDMTSIQYNNTGFAIVPEPTTLASALVGVGLLAYRARRRKV